MMNGYLLSWDARYLVEWSKNQCKIGFILISSLHLKIVGTKMTKDFQGLIHEKRLESHSTYSFAKKWLMGNDKYLQWLRLII